MGFVAQDTPTYAGLSVADHLRLGARLNPRWDDAVARSRIERLGLDPAQQAGKLSGGQRAQLALTLGLAKRPELLILDEPVASLDPLARREFLQILMEAVAEQELSVLLSSHVVSDLERVCDHLVVLVDSRVRVEGDVDSVLASHHRLTGPRRELDTLPADQYVVSASHTDRQTTLVVRTDAPVLDPAWTVSQPRPRRPGAGLPGRHPSRCARSRDGGPAMIWLTWRQFRAQAAAAAAFAVAFALVLAATGPRLVDIAATYRDVFDHLTRTDRNLFQAAIVVVAVAPVIIGVFWGAPLVARELEAGTHRLVWTQSVTRTRWLTTKLGVTTLAAAAAVGVLTFAVTWWSQPLDGALSSTRGSLPSRITPVTFAMRGVVPVGYAVFAVVLGATLGARAPAVAARDGCHPRRGHLRAGRGPDLDPPAPGADDRADGGVRPGPSRRDLDRRHRPGLAAADDGEHRRPGQLGADQRDHQCQRAGGLPCPRGSRDCIPRPPAPGTTGGSPVQARGPEALDACFTRLNDEGYRQHLVYQPKKNFWPLQWAELALYLALSGLLAGFCFWWEFCRLA